MATKEHGGARSPTKHRTDSTRTIMAIGATAMIVIGSLLPWTTTTLPSASVSYPGTDGTGLIAFGLGMVAGGLLLGAMKARTKIWWRAVAVVALASQLVSGAAVINAWQPIADNTQSAEAIGMGLPLTLLGSGGLLAAAYKVREGFKPARLTA